MSLFKKNYIKQQRSFNFMKFEDNHMSNIRQHAIFFNPIPSWYFQKLSFKANDKHIPSKWLIFNLEHVSS